MRYKIMTGVYGCLVTLEYITLFDTKLDIGFLCCLVEIKLAVVSFFCLLRVYIRLVYGRVAVHVVEIVT